MQEKFHADFAGLVCKSSFGLPNVDVDMLPVEQLSCLLRQSSTSSLPTKDRAE